VVVTNGEIFRIEIMLRPQRRSPPPRSVEETDSKLDRRCFIVRDANGHALAYGYPCGLRLRAVTTFVNEV
jgi:hypothetical protein